MGEVVADVVWSIGGGLFHSGGNTTSAAVRHGSKESFTWFLILCSVAHDACLSTW